MHVLMISMDTSLLTDSIGNSRARHEAYAQRAGKLSMIICAKAGSPRLDTYKSAQFTAYPTNSPNRPYSLIDGYRTGLRFNAKQPVDLIAAQDPFLTGLIGLALRQRLNVPLIIQDHSSLLDNPYFAAESRQHALLQRLARWTLPRADAVRVVNHAEEDACLRLGIPADRVRVIPVAPDIEGFAAPASVSQIEAWYDRLGTLGIDPDAPLALWVGRPVAVKNLPLLLRAFVRVQAEVPAARLILAGNTAKSDIPQQVAALGLSSSVCLPGQVAHADLPALYQIATVYAHASTYEGFGVVLAEAAAAGLPAVSTDTNGAREIIEDGVTGLLVPIGDETALAEALIRLLRDPDRAGAMGERARARISQRYEEAALIGQWVGMWREFTSPEKSSSPPVPLSTS